MTLHHVLADFRSPPLHSITSSAANEKRLRDREAAGLGGREIDDKLELIPSPADQNPLAQSRSPMDMTA